MFVADVSRLLFITWWVFAHFITSFYLAQLTAYLTLTEIDHKITTLDDFKERPHPPATWLALANTSFQSLIEVRINIPFHKY